MALSSLASVPITTLKGVGAKVAERLAKLGLFSVEDVLFHLPLRYEDRSRVVTMADCVAGTHVSVIGQVTSCNIQFGRRRMLVVKIADATGSMTLRFFNFSASQKNQFVIGSHFKCFGEIRRGKFGPEISHPEYKQIEPGQTITVEESLTPVYPATDGIKQITLRSLTEQALSRLEKYQVNELIPPDLLPVGLTLKQALSLCHRPPVDTSYEQLESATHPAQQRLIVEELVASQLGMLKNKHQLQADAATPLVATYKLQNKLLESLPFSPTNAQSRVVNEIQQDLSRPSPMLRLVQGDVGSGKTLVAMLTALTAIEAGYQVAVMAPTEILAEQHMLTMSKWLTDIGENTQDHHVTWLTSKIKASEKKTKLEAIATGQSKLIIGTHALFQEQVNFANLALIIVDEQHKFGVHQRLTLRNKGAFSENGQMVYPHQLVMTATPIPRTLAMTAYADLDISVIDELPPGRTPITTVAIPDSKREQVIDRVKQVNLSTGQQAYWVCTLIEESDALQAQAAEDSAISLQQALPELKVALVHGRMKADEKQVVMEQFKQGDIDLLVATTVIEVGVDVPNASLMIIENPERLGLAQLHQLRGRVGRGQHSSHCVLLYHAPLSQTASQRLGVLRDSNDGFVIAEKDMQIRGAGELLGTRQTGVAEYRIADLVRDEALVKVAANIAGKIAKTHPQHSEPLMQRWLGEKQLYRNA